MALVEPIKKSQGPRLDLSTCVEVTPRQVIKQVDGLPPKKRTTVVGLGNDLVSGLQAFESEYLDGLEPQDPTLVAFKQLKTLAGELRSKAFDAFALMGG